MEAAPSRGRDGRRRGGAEGIFAVDLHADASGGAEAGEAASEAPDRVLVGGERGGQMEREDRSGGAANRGGGSSGADGNFLADILGAGVDDAGQLRSQREASRGNFTSNAGGGRHDAQR